MDSRIENVLLFITQNFRKELLLDELADKAHLSKYHFQRIFKKEVGVSPLHYINKIKLEHAAHVLVVLQDCTPADAAFDSGFSSPAVFSRSFKKYYNQSPSQFKKEKRNSPVSKKHVNKINIPINYLNKQTIKVFPSDLRKDSLDNLFRNIQMKISKPEYIYGIFIDTPIHRSLDDCRYYAGIPVDNQSSKKKNILEIDEGYYTHINISGDFETLGKEILHFKEKYIDKSPYSIASPVGFEKLKLIPNDSSFDYFKIKRTIYIKIKR